MALIAVSYSIDTSIKEPTYYTRYKKLYDTLAEIGKCWDETTSLILVRTDWKPSLIAFKVGQCIDKTHDKALVFEAFSLEAEMVGKKMAKLP